MVISERISYKILYASGTPADVSLYKLEMLIFIDESGSNDRDTLRKYGYSIRGKPPRSLKLLVYGEWVSVITALSNDSVETLRVVRGIVWMVTLF